MAAINESATTMTADVAVTSAAPNRRNRNENRPIWMEETPFWLKVVKAVTLLLIVFVTLFPMLYVLAVSFSSARDVVGSNLILFPRNPTFDAYREIFRGGIVTRALRVSIGLTLFGTLAQVVATTMLAYGLSRPGVPGAKFVLFLVLGAFLFTPGMIPSYLLVKELGLLNTYASLILPGLIGAFNLIVMRGFFMGLPQELLDAARVDGANDAQIFFRIVLPLSKAVIAVIALFYGVGIWNSFFSAVLYLSDAGMWPIQMVLRQYVLQGSALTSGTLDPNQPPPPTQTIQMAIVVVATVPILIVYPFLQKYFTKGVLTGAIKG